jgi:hypothetical protein
MNHEGKNGFATKTRRAQSSTKKRKKYKDASVVALRYEGSCPSLSSLRGTKQSPVSENKLLKGKKFLPQRLKEHKTTQRFFIRVHS